MSKLNLTGKFLRQYRSKKTGTTVFVYEVSGDEASQEEYKEAQGVHFVEDTETGTPLFFTTDYAGKSVSILISSTNKAFADMSEFDAQASLVKRYGGNLGQEIARQSVAKLLGGSTAPAQTAPQPAEKSAEAENMGEV